MRIDRQQLLIGQDSPALIIFLQLRTGDLIRAVVRIIRTRVATDQVLEHADLIVVLMQQTERIPFLEQRIVRSGRVDVAHLGVVRDGVAEIARVEVTVTYTVECIGIGRFGRQRSIDIRRERRPRLVVLTLRERGVTLQVLSDRVVIRLLSIRTRQETVHVRLTRHIITQAVLRFTAQVIRLGRVLVRLRRVVDHLGRPVDRLLHLTLQETIGT